MKKLLFILSLIAFIPNTYADDLDKAREEVKQYFIGDDEPKVKDAAWTSDFVFKVGVKDDGTNRNGYAEYVCLELYSRGFKDKGVLVKVIDINKLVQTGEWVDLGMAKCQ